MLLRIFLLCTLFANVLCEDDDCEVDGVKGKCLDIRACPTALNDIKQRIKPKICSFNGTSTIPNVCCLTPVTNVDTKSSVPSEADNEKLSYKLGRKAEQKCNIYSSQPGLTGDVCFIEIKQQRRRKRDQEFVPIKKVLPDPMPANTTDDELDKKAVIGGYATARKEYPHMALLGYGPDLESAKWHCSGAMISEKYILTAAHCISDPDLGPVRFIALGIVNRTDPEEMWHRYGVKRIIPHPLYQSPAKYHDIALLETDNFIKFSTDVLPACLDLGYTEMKATTFIVTATGWGVLGNNKDLADNLQKVNLKMFTKEECKSQYPEHRHLKNGYDHETQMCFGDKQTIRNTCMGDSGGPLQVQYYESDKEKPKCQYEIIGVTSFGLQCHVLGNAGIYTRVRYYMPWIESVVWP